MAGRCAARPGSRARDSRRGSRADRRGRPERRAAGRRSRSAGAPAARRKRMHKIARETIVENPDREERQDSHDHRDGHRPRRQAIAPRNHPDAILTNCSGKIFSASVEERIPLMDESLRDRRQREQVERSDSLGNAALRRANTPSPSVPSCTVFIRTGSPAGSTKPSRSGRPFAFFREHLDLRQ